MTDQNEIAELKKRIQEMNNTVSKLEKKQNKKNNVSLEDIVKLILAIGIIIFLCNLFGVFEDNGKSTNDSNTNNTSSYEQYYKKRYTIDASLLEGLADESVNLKSDLTSFPTVVTKLKDGDVVTLNFYKDEDQYCKVTSGKVEGWLNCCFLKEFPDKYKSACD